jgi:hypothetical protein
MIQGLRGGRYQETEGEEESQTKMRRREREYISDLNWASRAHHVGVSDILYFIGPCLLDNAIENRDNTTR